MNKAYRLIWNRAKDAWVIAAEIVKGNGGPPPITISAVLVAASLALAAGGAQALPVAPTVINGTVNFGTSGNTLTITNSLNSIINWQAFSIAANETVRFNQQSALSSVLNRVTGADPSQILGALQSNGKVFLINPNGIIFGQGSRIDVGGLVASSLGISNQDFMAGSYRFTGDAQSGAVRNRGSLTTTAGGLVWLISPDVENSGVIASPNGSVMLAAGQSVQMVDPQRPEIAVVISAPADRAVNMGDILVQGGAAGIFGSLVNQQGVINADSAVAGENGRIFLKSSVATTLGSGSITSANALDNGKGGTIAVLSDGETRVAGTLSANGGTNGGDGGFIETSGSSVFFEGARITASAGRGKAGLWLIDPSDLTIDAAGAGNISSTLNAGTDVTATTSACNPSHGVCGPGTTGNLTVSSGITWTTANQLTLLADNNISINAAISGADGTLNLYTPQTGTTTQTAPITAANLNLSGIPDPTYGWQTQGGTFTLQHPDNAIGTLTGDVTALTLFNSKSLTIGVGTYPRQNLSASGDIIIEADASGTPGQHGIILDGYYTRSRYGNVTLKGTAGSGGSGIVISANAGGEVPAVGAYGNLTLKGYGGGAGGFGIQNYGDRVTAPNIMVITKGGVDNLLADFDTASFTNSVSGDISVRIRGYSSPGYRVVGGSNSAAGGGFSVDGRNEWGGMEISGITTSNGDVTLAARHGVRFTGAINAGTAAVTIEQTSYGYGGISGLSGASSINAGSATLRATDGIGSAADPFRTAVSVLNVANNGSGEVQISNTGNVTVNNLVNTGGSVTLDNMGAVTLNGDAINGTGVYAGYVPGSAPFLNSNGCDVSITAHSPLTVNGPVWATGNITLTAGSSGSQLDTLLVNPAASVSAGQNATLTAGNLVTMNSPVLVGQVVPPGSLSVTQGLNPPPPDITPLDVATFINDVVWTMGRESTDLSDEDNDIYQGGRHGEAGNPTYCN